MTAGPWLLAAAGGMLGGILAARRAPRLGLGLTLGAAAAALVAAGLVLLGGEDWRWGSPWSLDGEPVALRLDALAAFFLVLLAWVGGAATLFGHGYWTDRAHPRSAPAGRAWWNAMLLSIALVLLAAHGMLFLIAWELFAVSGYFLITLDRSRREVRAAGWLYLGASHAGTLALFAFFTALATRTGGWALGPMGDRADLAPLFWLALLGFGLKAGLFPLHIWLPSAHANAPSHVSALLSGVAIKVGIYGLVRFTGWLPVPAAAGWVVAGLGAASAVLGVAFALGQHDLKRLLAYHSVENIGIILLGLGFALIAASANQPAWGTLALAGGLLHVWNHGLFKALLFCGAGSVLHATGTRTMSRLGGLWRAMPWTTALFALGAAAIAGLPPLNGFVSEWLVYLGLMESILARGPTAWAALPAVILLGLTGALALACFVKVCGVVFLGAPRSAAAARAHEAGPALRGAMFLLAGACLAIGLGPALTWPVLARVAAGWRPAWAGLAPPPSLVALGTAHLGLAAAAVLAGAFLWKRAGRLGWRRAPTWDCGFAAPDARMQYTAGSFADTITGWFDWILRPERHDHPPEGVFPAHASRHTHTPETVLERVVGPVAAAVMRVSTATRRLQQGRIQAYLAYLVLGTAVLAVLVLL